MSRSGYSDDCENLWLWRGAVANAIRGKRGQAFLRELLAALDELPQKRLVANALQDENGEVCALGSVGRRRGVADLEYMDVENREKIARTFGIAEALAAEIEYENDEAGHWQETPEARFVRVRAWVAAQLRPESA